MGHQFSSKQHSCDTNSHLNGNKGLQRTGSHVKRKNGILFDMLPHEVASRYRDRGVHDLYEWQKDLLLKNEHSKRQNFVFSLPTSGGKSLVSEIMLLKAVYDPVIRSDDVSQPLKGVFTQQPKSGMLILPFVSLVDEKTRALREIVEGIPTSQNHTVSVEDYSGTRGRADPLQPPCVYICTIEKASGLINTFFESGRIQELQVVVIDELHMVNETGGRGITLELLVAKLLAGKQDTQLIGMSATIPNLKDLASWISGTHHEYDFRPVQLKSYVVHERVVYPTKLIEQGNAFSDLKYEDTSIAGTRRLMKNPREDKKDSGFHESSTDLESLLALVDEVFLIHSAIVFCPTKRNAENTASFLAEKLWAVERNVDPSHLNCAADAEVEAQDEGVHLQQSLLSLLKKRVAYHHSGLTMEERRFVEERFRRKKIFILACTSTLATGVNLPVRRVIVYSPQVGAKFMKKSQYLQMIGRAGRAGLDEIGESFLLFRSKDKSIVEKMLQSNSEAIESCMLPESLQRADHATLEQTFARYALDIIGCSICRIKYHVLQSFSTLFAFSRNSELFLSFGEKAIQTLVEHKLVICHKMMVAEFGPLCSLEIDNSNDHFELSAFGRSVLRSNLPIRQAILIHEELVEVQRTGLVLDDNLHLLYFLTPIKDCLEPHWELYRNLFNKLTPKQLNIAEKLHISEYHIQQRASGILLRSETTSLKSDQHTLKRFWNAMILSDILDEKPMDRISRKFGATSVDVQNLMRNTSYFAHSISVFCENMQWFLLHKMVSSLISRVTLGCRPDIVSLVSVRGVQASRARLLLQVGINTIEALARADPHRLHREVGTFLEKRASRSHQPVKVYFTLSTANLLIANAKQALVDLASQKNKIASD